MLKWQPSSSLTNQIQLMYNKTSRQIWIAAIKGMRTNPPICWYATEDAKRLPIFEHRDLCSIGSIYWENLVGKSKLRLKEGGGLRDQSLKEALIPSWLLGGWGVISLMSPERLPRSNDVLLNKYVDVVSRSGWGPPDLPKRWLGRVGDMAQWCS